MAAPVDHNPKLPMDVLDQILDEYSNDKFFAHKCGKILFRDLREISVHNRQHIGALVELMNNRLEIASWIKSLTYHVDLVPGRVTPPMANLTLVSYLDASDSLVSRFLNLPTLQSLCIVGEFDPFMSSYLTFEDDTETYPSRQIDFIHLLDAYLPTTTLTHLEIREISDLPTHAILTCPNLHTLDLFNCTLAPLPTHSRTCTGRIQDLRIVTFTDSKSIVPIIHVLLQLNPSLESVALESMGRNAWSRLVMHPESSMEIVPTFYPAFGNLVRITDSGWLLMWPKFCEMANERGVNPFPALKVLNLELPPADDGITNTLRFLSQFTTSLEELSIKVSAFKSYIDDVWQIPEHFPLLGPNLKRLSLLWDYRALDLRHPYLASILNALKNISTTTILETLTSVMSPSYLRSSGVDPDLIRDLVVGLDDMIGESDHSFTCLKTVDIHIPDDGESLQRVLNSMPKILHWLRIHENGCADGPGLDMPKVNWVLQSTVTKD
ncbi:hypothetical protein CVT24_012089 [Panaeolus cyanescens]|uniref:F-box domain-containing protein n=1 Tax=Panaeolus cyanescens TaxID=181874 RepID=A0A409YNA7_9AGAR|nr:hypothetical protein CVT24_012089 [Panaeolus cyanescens]